jgi:hypothetical protein
MRISCFLHGNQHLFLADGPTGMAMALFVSILSALFAASELEYASLKKQNMGFFVIQELLSGDCINLFLRS